MLDTQPGSVWFCCGSISQDSGYHQSPRCRSNSQLNEANEYARKLSIKVTDQGVEIQRINQHISELKGKLELAQNDLAMRTSELEKAEETIQLKQDAGDLLFEELDDLTPEADCKCVPHGILCHSCLFKTSRTALKAWKEANK